MNNVAIADLVEEKLGELNTERKQLVADIDTAKREAASPLSDSLEELDTLAGVLAKDNSEVSAPVAPHALFLEAVEYPAELYLTS